MRKKTCKLALAFSVLSGIFLVPAQGQDKLLLATEAAYAPFNQLGADGQPTGFDIDIGNALCAEMQVECEWVINDWDGIIPALMSRKFDAIVSSMSMTAERKERVDFTIPYYQDAVRFMVAKGSGIVDVSQEAMSGLRIGTQRSSSQGAWLEDTFPDSELVWYNNVDEAYLDLDAGRIDAALSFQIPLSVWIAESDIGDCCELVGPEIHNTDYFGEGHAIALRKDSEELRHRFNQAIVAIVENGTYKAINDKYFSVSIWPGVPEGFKPDQ